MQVVLELVTGPRHIKDDRPTVTSEAHASGARKDDGLTANSAVYAVLELCTSHLLRHLPRISPAHVGGGGAAHAQAELCDLEKEVCSVCIGVVSVLPRLCTKPTTTRGHVLAPVLVILTNTLRYYTHAFEAIVLRVCECVRDVFVFMLTLTNNYHYCRG